MTKGRAPAGARRPRHLNGEGFTLLEMMIALLILGIVLGAVAPAFYGVMQAGNNSNFRSVANGIAVQSAEQLRSYPYYEIGYTSSSQAPTGCNTPVVLPSTVTTTPITSLPSTQKIGNVTYTITRCISWVNASTGDTLAYKKVLVTISWSANGLSGSIVHTSALYPGADGAYVSGGQQDYAPSVTTTTLGTAPAAPASVTASDDLGSTGTILDVSWPAVTGASSYNVWFTSTNPNGAAVSTISGAQEDVQVTSTTDYLDVSANTNYYVQVIAVNSAGSSSPTSASPYPENSGAATSGTSTTTSTTTGSSTTTTSTTVAPTTTTTTLPCTATAITVNPAGSTGSPANLNSSPHTLAENNGSFIISVTISGSGCAPQVAYNTTGCVPGATGCAASYLSTYTVAGNTYTFDSNPSTTWTDQTTQVFIPVVNSVLSTTLSAQSYVCVEDGKSGNCK